MKSFTGSSRMLLGLFFLLAAVVAGCLLLPPADETIVTPSGVIPTPTHSVPGPSVTPTVSGPPASATPVQTSTAHQATATPVPPTESTSRPTPLPTDLPSSWEDLEPLDNSKTGWYYVPASTLGIDQPATLPQAVLDLLAQYAVLWQQKSPPEKILYLTMDQGYEYMNLTDRILDIARDKQVPITFFITGSYIRRNPERVQRMVAEGHQVANHTLSHPNLVDLLAEKGPQAVLDELKAVEIEFAALTGRTLPPVLRPPEGSYSKRLLAVLDRAGYRTVFWSFAYRDWLTDDQPDPQEALQKILDQLHPGSVLLLHSVSETNAAILPDLIDAALARGYTFQLLPD